jgi:hypothetical protein
MMHGDRSRGPPPYHPGWGGLARKLVLEENTVQTMYGLALAPLMLQLECSLQARRGSDAHTLGVGSDCFILGR